MDVDWHAFVQTIFKSIEGEEWLEMYECYKQMNRAAGVKKPSGHQKAKALGEMKAAKDRDEEFFDASLADHIRERNKTRFGFMGGTSQRPNESLGEGNAVVGVPSVWLKLS